MKFWIYLLVGLFPILGSAQPYSVDWFKVAGGGGTSTSAVFTVTGTFGQQDAASMMQGGGFRVTGGFWSLLGQQATPPSIVTPPESLTITNGPTAGFTVLAIGTQPLSYQWRQNGINLADSGNISGSTTSNLTVTVTGTNNAGDYSVVVANSFGSVTSSVATLTLLFSPVITGQTENTVGHLGGTLRLGVEVSGNGPFTYQWLSDGVSVPINGNIITVAGNGIGGYNGDSIVATDAMLDFPSAVAVDAARNFFIADSFNQRIRKVSTNGIITTVAGNGIAGYNGDNIAATNAKLSYPFGVAMDAAGNLFIADSNERIRKVSTNGIITTVAGNGSHGYNGDNIAATNAALSNPGDMAVDAAGNLFIADYSNHRIRKVSTNGIITTVAGNGSQGYNGDNIAATNAKLNHPSGVAVDGAGNLFVADYDNSRIRKVSANGVITTVAGTANVGYNGDHILATNAELGLAQDVTVDAVGNLFIVDYYNQLIRKVNTDGIITTVAGNGSLGYNGDNIPATNAVLYFPSGVTVDAAGNLFIADTYSARVRKVNSSSFSQLANGSLVLNNVSANDAGNYSVVVTSPYGSVTGTVPAVVVVGPNGDTIFQDAFDPSTNGTSQYYGGDVGNVSVGIVPGVGLGGTAALRARCDVSNGPNGFGYLAAQWQGETVSGNVDTNLTHYRLSFDAYVTGDAQHQSGGGFSLGILEGAGPHFSTPFPQGTLQTYQPFQGGADLRVSQSGVWQHFDLNLGGPAFMGTNGFNDHFNPTGATWQINFQMNTGDWGAEPQTGTTLIIDNLTLKLGALPVVITSSNPALVNGQFGSDFSGPAGTWMVIQASTDFLNWAPLQTNMFRGEPFHFSDPQLPLLPQRFYRAVPRP